DRGNNCIKDLEDERDREVRPLNTQVKEINEKYRTPRETLKKVCADLLSRLDARAKYIESERRRAAEETARIAAMAAQKAREAEDAERLAREEAGHGVIVDTAEKTAQADAAFEEYKKAQRKAAIAERELERPEIPRGIGRAIGIKEREVP